MNNLKKENLKLQEDNKTAKRAEEKAKKKLEDLVSIYLRPFGNNLCKVLEIPMVQFDQQAINLPIAKGSKTLHESYVEGYLKALLKNVQEREKMSKSFADMNNFSAIENKANISYATADANETKNISTFNITTNNDIVSNLHDHSQSSI